MGLLASRATRISSQKAFRSPSGLGEFRARLTVIQEVGHYYKVPQNKARALICLRQRKRQAPGKTIVGVILTIARQVRGQNTGEGRGSTGPVSKDQDIRGTE